MPLQESLRPTAIRLSRRTLLTGGLAVAAVPFVPGFVSSAFGQDVGDADGYGTRDSRAFGFPEPDMTTRVVRPMVFPIEGPVSWTDTYGACRDGCSRKHEGQDIIGKKMQKLIACVSGTVVAFKHSSEGNYLHLRDSDGWHYGYLHINNDTPGTDDGSNKIEFAFAPGIALGAQVRQGQVIGYLGDSGNAESTVPHLHFELRKPASAWYSAQAVNAAYSLDAAGTATIADPLYAPFTTPAAFVRQQYSDFLAREPQSAEVTGWVTELTSGARTAPSLISFFMSSPEFQAKVAPIIRLYFGYFQRMPDTGGILYWLDQVRQGTDAARISQEFARSREFVATYGSLSNGAFVDLVYRNVLERTPDVGGRQYWIDRLNAGTTRGSVMVNFTESPEYRIKLNTIVVVVMSYVGMLRRCPASAGLMYWVDQIKRLGTSPLSLVKTIQFSGEYAARFSG